MSEIECEHLKNGICHVASSIAGIPCKAYEMNCRVCLAGDEPKTVNPPTKGLAIAALREAGKPYDWLTHYKPTPGEGPGTELKNLLSWFASEREGCQCKDRAAKMNRWGVEGCRERIDTIVGWLSEEARKRSSASAVVPTIVYRTLVKKAIDRAEKAEEPKPPPHPEWFVAITTAPRKDPTLYECVGSIRKAGWEPVVFAEPGSPPTNCETVANPERLGVWHNWMAAMKLGLQTDAQYILTFQDDVVIHPDSRQIAEHAIADCSGFLSLYTMRKYGRMRGNGIVRIHTKSLWGACALIFPRNVAERVVAHEIAQNWLGATPKTKATRHQTYENRRRNPHRIGNSDTAIGKVMNALKLPMEFVNPSAAIHIARYSAMGHGGNSGNRNCDPCADFEKPLWEQVYGKSRSVGA